MTRFLNTQWIILAFIAVALAGDAATMADTITLRSSVRVEAGTQVLRLSDVARLEGSHAELLDNLVIVDFAIEPGRTKVTLDDVRNAMRAARINEGPLALSGRQCRVRRIKPASEPEVEVKATEPEIVQPVITDEESIDHEIGNVLPMLEQPTLRGILASYIMRHMVSAPGEDVLLSFDLRHPEHLDLDTTTYDFDVEPKAVGRGGAIPFYVGVYQGDERVSTVRVTASIKIRREVYVVKRMLRRDDVIGHGDLEIETRVLPPHPEGVVHPSTEVVSLVCRGTLKPGDVLRPMDLEQPLLVRRNQDATLRVRVGNIIVNQMVQVLEAGASGDVVRVRRFSDRVEMYGRVVAIGQLVLIGE